MENVPGMILCREHPSWSGGDFPRSTDDDLAEQLAPDPDGLAARLVTGFPEEPSVGRSPVEVVALHLPHLPSFGDHRVNGHHAPDMADLEGTGFDGTFQYHRDRDAGRAVAAL